MLKFSTGFILLFIALFLQFMFASVGIFANLSFAALIAFAFIYGFWEMVALVALSVFVLNWQPTASVEILVYALYPIAVNIFKEIVTWKAWVVAPAATIAGFSALYVAVAPGFLASHPWRAVIDLFAGLAYGGLVFLPLHHFERR